MQLKVTAIQTRSIGVKSFELRPIEPLPLPQFEPGAHIRITLPQIKLGDNTRAYSLVSDPTDRTRYEIAVLHVEPSKGGSALMHNDVKVGDVLEVTGPRNDFRIEDSKAHSILIAGGIGVTPILSLARELARNDSSMEVHYVGKGQDRMPYKDELLALSQSQTHLYFSRRELKLYRIIRSDRTAAHIYVCGPHGLIEAVREAAEQAGIAASRLHFESFGYRRQPQDQPVEVELRTSGISLWVEPGRPLIEAIEAVGAWIPSDCRKGECGTCITSILEGAVDHRDHCLTIEQRQTLLCPCVSWARTNKLTLDL